MILRRGDKNTQKNYKKKIFTTQIIMKITHLEPDILDWEVNGPQEASLETKLVEVMEFRLSYFIS